EEIASVLVKSGVSSEFYHGGLDNDKRSQIQQNWIENRTRIVVCTNAFGMGIDKSDVRVVFHYERPDSPEAYYQEAGRAGRDGLESYCILLTSNEKQSDFWKIFPTLPEVDKTLKCLYNFHQISFTAGKGVTYSLDIIRFSENFKMIPRMVVQSMSVLHSMGYLKLNEPNFMMPKIKFLAPQSELYAYQVKNKVQDMFIKLLLRSYSGLFDHYIPIRLPELAKRQKCSISDLKKNFAILQRDGIVDFIDENKGNSVTYLQARPTEIKLNKKDYLKLTEQEEKRRDAMSLYEHNMSLCRQGVLLEYFGEQAKEACGKCDICRLGKKSKLQNVEVDEIVKRLRNILENKNLELDVIVSSFGTFEEQQVISVVKWLLDNEYLTKTNQTYTWTQDQK
ncbi:MAG: helicase-related protein, partial [Bacteroidia bacterium]